MTAVSSAVSGIIHVLRTGIPWRAAPKEYGPGRTLCNHFRRWAEKGIWEQMFASLADEGGPERVAFDSTTMRAHRSASGGKGAAQQQCIGRSRGRPHDQDPPRDRRLGRPLLVALSRPP